MLQMSACRKTSTRVNVVLEEIEAAEIPTLLVMNKIDMLDDFEPRIDRDEENKPFGSGFPPRPVLACHCFSSFDRTSFR